MVQIFFMQIDTQLFCLKLAFDWTTEQTSENKNKKQHHQQQNRNKTQQPSKWT